MLGVYEYAVGMGRDSSCLSHGMSSMPFILAFIWITHSQHFFVTAQLGYDFGVTLPGGYHGVVSLPGSTPSVMYSDVQCDGGEDSIWDCTMSTNDDSNSECCSNCYEKSVAVYCSRFC